MSVVVNFTFFFSSNIFVTNSIFHCLQQSLLVYTHRIYPVDVFWMYCVCVSVYRYEFVVFLLLFAHDCHDDGYFSFAVYLTSPTCMCSCDCARLWIANEMDALYYKIQIETDSSAVQSYSVRNEQNNMDKMMLPIWRCHKIRWGDQTYNLTRFTDFCTFIRKTQWIAYNFFSMPIM